MASHCVRQGRPKGLCSVHITSLMEPHTRVDFYTRLKADCSPHKPTKNSASVLYSAFMRVQTSGKWKLRQVSSPIYKNWTFCVLDVLYPGRSVIGRLVTGRFVTGRYVTGRLWVYLVHKLISSTTRLDLIRKLG